MALINTKFVIKEFKQLLFSIILKTIFLCKNNIFKITSICFAFCVLV